MLLLSAAGQTAIRQAPSPASGPLFEQGWRLRLRERPSAPAAFDSTHAYVPLRDGKLAAIAITDGRNLWTVDAPTTLAPAAGEMLVFVAGKRDIRALDVTSGREKWRLLLDATVSVAPLFDTSWLFVGTEDGRLTALRAVDGDVVWQIDTRSRLSAAPAPAGTRLYVPLSDGQVLAADLLTGKTVWTRRLGAAATEILALDDRLFVGSQDNYFYCLGLTDGAVKWKWRTGGDIVGTPIVDETRVYFLSLDNVLRALDRHNGSQRWHRAMPGRPIGGPLRSGSLIVAATLAPQLHAFHRTDGQPAGTSPPPEGDDLTSTLAAPPHLVSLQGRNGFVLLMRQGVIELLRYTGSV